MQCFFVIIGVRNRLLGGAIERRTLEDVFDDATAPSGFFDGAQGTLTEAVGWRDTVVVVVVPRTSALPRTAPPALAEVVDEQLPLDEVRYLTRCGRSTTPPDVVAVVRREDGPSLPGATPGGVVRVDAVAALAFLASAAARLLLRSTGAAIVARVGDWRTNAGGGAALRPLGVDFRSSAAISDDERRNGPGSAVDAAAATPPAAGGRGVLPAGRLFAAAVTADLVEDAPPRDVDDAARELPRRGVAGAGLAATVLVCRALAAAA